MNLLRAWFSLVGFSFRRQMRLRQMVWIALSLLAIQVIVVYLVGISTGWDLLDRKPRPRQPTYAEWLLMLETYQALRPAGGAVSAGHEAIIGVVKAALDHSGFAVFSRQVVMSIFIGFLLPLWTLSFAVSSYGAERESRTLVWLNSRPIPRSAQYLAKLVGTLPWSVGFSLLGFGLICAAAGEPGLTALTHYWPAVAGGAVAFTSLFHLIGAIAPRPAIVSLVYAFFIEALASDLLPGTLKRVSISYYARCLVYHEAADRGWVVENPLVLQPIDPTSCWAVLGGISVLFTVVGMFWYARTELRDDI